VSEIVLKVEDLHTSFFTRQGEVKAVDGVSFYVREAETFGIVGESGCGKTVTGLSILRLLPEPGGRIISGKIIMEGRNLMELSKKAMRAYRGKMISMILQDPMTSLNPVFTVGDQIKEAILVHENIGIAELQERCLQLLRDVGIPSPEERISDYPHQLSGGQRQRVMIAMALGCNPDLVIADEPTTALDVTIQKQILNLFGKLQKKRDMSILYITHDLNVVSNIADRIYVMYAGGIVEQGTREAIFKEPHHPYTQGLLASLPNRSKRGGTLHSIPGTVPDPAFKPRGCPFHPRCGYVIETCRIEYPELCDYGEGHLSRCPVLYARRSV